MANLATLFLAGIPALLIQGLSAQVVTKTPALIVSGVLEQGQLPPSSLGLGGGGLGSRRFADRNEPGRWVSPGGILVRARKEGVKIDFPSGAELLVTPSARVCLRGGEQTLLGDPDRLHGRVQPSRVALSNRSRPALSRRSRRPFERSIDLVRTKKIFLGRPIPANNR